MMAGTPTPIARIMSRLAADTAWATLVTGGTYDRELTREGPGATPDAFAPTFPYQMRVSAVVRDGGDGVAPLGPGLAVFGFPTIWLYAPRTSSGRDAVATAVDLAIGLLHGWTFAMPNGTGSQLTYANRIGVLDDPVLDNAVVDGVRFQMAGLLRLAS